MVVSHENLENNFRNDFDFVYAPNMRKYKYQNEINNWYIIK